MGLRRRLDDRWCTRRIHRGDPAKPRSDRCSRQPWWCAVIGTVLPVCRPWSRPVAVGADVCMEPVMDVRDRFGSRPHHSRVIRVISTVDATTIGR